jgi:hypothetical protein
MPADQALRAWMDRFIDYMTTKRGMGDALRSLIASGGDPFSQGRDRLTAAVTTLLHAGAVDRTLRHDVEPDDCWSASAACRSPPLITTPRASRPPARPAHGRPAPPPLRDRVGAS